MGHNRNYFANVADLKAIEDECLWSDRPLPRSIYDMLCRTHEQFGARAAVSYQLFSDPKAAAQTLSWSQLHGKVTQAANMFRSLGVEQDEVVAYILPNALETVVTLLGGAVCGIVNPINPLLEPDKIASILRETKAKVVVTLKPFPKTDVPQKVAEALLDAPDVHTVIEVDLAGYLTGLKRVIVPMIRPKNPAKHQARVLDFNAEIARHPADRLTFEDESADRIGAYFHTGGTTGMPKVAQHRVSGMIYNGWLGARLLFDEEDCVMCPLPMFHVFAVYPILMSVIASGGHVVFPTPAGYRGDGVFDNFWKLIERYRCTYMITVPTALSALMQRPINADISTLKNAFSGSASLPLELYNRFKAETGIEIIEGYGLTEATCLISCNPPGGTRKIGSVGLPFPHCDVRILKKTDAGFKPCGVDAIGEICVANPGVVVGATYIEAEKNRDLFVEGRFLRTGDLGRIDADGYLFITGRAKDLIIRGGHNVDPASIEEALMGHKAVAFVGAIGQPDEHSGEIPCAYVELVAGASVSVAELLEHATAHVDERAAIPKHIEILDELPKTAVGKVFKPDLRRLAIVRVYNEALESIGVPAHVTEVKEDKKRGLVACIYPIDRALISVEKDSVKNLLGRFTTQWELVEETSEEAKNS